MQTLCLLVHLVEPGCSTGSVRGSYLTAPESCLMSLPGSSPSAHAAAACVASAIASLVQAEVITCDHGFGKSVQK